MHYFSVFLKKKLQSTIRDIFFITTQGVNIYIYIYIHRETHTLKGNTIFTKQLSPTYDII